ncbi:MAG TPA: apolipoprotein N-acyltransferase [Terriglobia bacterium]|nr:apolipoprotein N-acyltransferase [Terriglobia bacterium]
MNGERQIVTEDRRPITDNRGHPSSFIIQRSSFRFLLSVVSGVLLFACFPLLNAHALVWVATVPLLVAVVGERRLGRAYLLGALAGAVFLAGSVYWFTFVMAHYGGMPEGLALAVMVPFLAVFSSFWGLFGLVECWMARRSPALALAAAPFLWVSLELARTYYFITGFPWNLLGYAVQPTGLRQLASVTAVYGLSWIAVATSALGASVPLLRKRRRPLAIALLAWCIMLAAANRALAPLPLPPATDTAVLVQPNVPLNEAADDWAPWKNPAPLERLISLSIASLPRPASASATLDGAPGTPPLIVWSENSAPFYFNRDPVFRKAVESMARQAHAYAVVGAVDFSGPGETLPRNSAVALDPSGSVILRYDKIRLVPFGEYVPAWAAAVAGKITSEAGDFVPGTNYESAATPRGKIGVFICYEAIFPQLVRRLTPPGPGVLVNISDDGWYGDSSAAFQSLEMARLRAIENRRYLLRATNDGITAVIDPYGRVLGRLPRHEQAVLPAHFSFIGARTFYSAHGDVFAWLCVVASGLVVAFRGLGRRPRALATKD